MNPVTGIEPQFSVLARGEGATADYWGAPARERERGLITVLHMLLSFSGVTLFVDCTN